MTKRKKKNIKVHMNGFQCTIAQNKEEKKSREYRVVVVK